MSERSRPLRNLAAWGYASDASGTRVEIDVWTVNPGEREERDCAARARAAFPENIELIDCAGNVAKVYYKGIDAEGYRYIDSNEKAPQTAYAGAKRSAGGTRTTGGTFTEGWVSPEGSPDFGQVLEHGIEKVIPVVRREMRELGRKITREPPRDEKDEPVEQSPFEGFRNVVRVMVDPGGTYRYRVRNGSLESA